MNYKAEEYNLFYDSLSTFVLFMCGISEKENKEYFLFFVNCFKYSKESGENLKNITYS